LKQQQKAEEKAEKDKIKNDEKKEKA